MLKNPAQAKDSAPQTEAVRELLQGNKLRCGDILLVHRQRKIMARLIRALTGSYWNHVAIVYGSECCAGCPNTWLIEAMAGGVQIHRLEDYLAHPEVADMGIRRLEADWFSPDTKAYSPHMQRSGTVGLLPGGWKGETGRGRVV